NTSISVAYDAVSSAVQYELQLTCPNITRSEVTTETSYTFSNIPPNTICSVQVRVLATVGSTSSARSDFSASVETTSLPAVTGLRATSINETSVVIVFNFVKRAVSYTVQSGTNITVLTQNNVVSGVLSLPVEGVSRSTTYTYLVVVVATDVDGKQHESEPAKLVFTTDGLCRVNLCLNGGICYENQGVSGCLCLSGFTGTLCENSDIDLTLLLGLVIPACVILLGALIVLILRQYNKKNKFYKHEDVQQLNDCLYPASNLVHI
uniref:EGF-like domain-containing protein n=1 Tax=Ciona savignyi TaxID=51511 RepID=H2YEP6_CIOSA